MSGHTPGPWNGMPVSPEKDGWHWVEICGCDAEPTRWLAKRQQWELQAGIYNPDTVAQEAEYHGPVVRDDGGETAKVYWAALLAIAHMDCYTREGEEMPHLLMMRIAKEALASATGTP